MKKFLIFIFSIGVLYCNNIVEEISNREKINKTLFFSKKAQKDLLRLVMAEGLDFACKEITPWRSRLIKGDLLNLLK